MSQQEYNITIRCMAERDLIACDQLRAAVGWNQLFADWQRLFRLEPAGCFVAEVQGQIVGTTTVTTYANILAWVGMVLVHPDYRRRRIGYALVQRCLEYAQDRSVSSVKLDATPLGKTLYDQFGFSDESTLARWACDHYEVPGTQPNSPNSTYVIRPIAPAEFEAICEIDAKAQGFVRNEVLLEVMKQSSHVAVATNATHDPARGHIVGFGMIRHGAHADYMGPLVASEPQVANEVARFLLAQHARKPIYWDIPDVNSSAVDLATSLGFVRQRPFIRMCQGEQGPDNRLDWQFAIAGPATG